VLQSERHVNRTNQLEKCCSIRETNWDSYCVYQHVFWSVHTLAFGKSSIHHLIFLVLPPLKKSSAPNKSL